MNVVILEDEERTARHLENLLLQSDPSLRVCATISSVAAAASWFATNPSPDLIMMDIHLEDELVFELFNRVAIRVPVIFTTAYDQYMLQAFKVSGIEYLLKPVQSGDLAIALYKFRSFRQHFAPADYGQLKTIIAEQTAGKYRDRFLITMGNKLLSVETSEIAYIMLVSKITYIITFANRRFIITHSLEELVSMLDPKQFFRVNRQCIVGLSAIVDASQNKRLQVKLILNPAAAGDVMVSGDRLTAFKEWLGK